MIAVNKTEAERDYILKLEFFSGKIKREDLRPCPYKGIFNQLTHKNYFRLIKNNHYFISWPNNQELRLDTLYYS